MREFLEWLASAAIAIVKFVVMVVALFVTLVLALPVSIVMALGDAACREHDSMFGKHE